MRAPCLVMGLALLVAPNAARADSTPDAAEGTDVPVAAGFLAGAATAMVPLGVGATLIATSQQREIRNAGVYVIESGFVLAPLIAHGIVHEWKRGAFFSLGPAVGAAGMVTLLQMNPDVMIRGKVGPQQMFLVCLVTTMATSMIGVIDTASAGERSVLRGVTVMPLVARGELGLAIGGSL